MTHLFKNILISLALITTIAHAEDIRIIVPYAPGGGFDITARKIAPLLTKSTGLPVVVENHTGGNSSIGTNIVVNSKPDGKTLLISTVGTLDGSNSEMTVPLYDWQKDLRPVAIAVPVSPFVLVTSKKYTSFKQFNEALKTNRISYGSPTVAGSHVILMRELIKSTGTTNKDIVPVIYKSSPTLLTDVVSGQLDATFATAYAVQGLIASGKLNALAVASTKRLDYLPDTPTFTELGLNKVSVGTDYYGIWVAAATPDTVVEELRNNIYSYVGPGGELRKEFLEMHFIDPHYQIPRNPEEEQRRYLKLIKSLQ
jgi:tripartite-type tricarboxylate transporter receptor subunit TctC